ncbi:hypothetical protein DM860_006599 [Cuscuta australis]|uniref:Uncharacterized protein n=1 Tax=Cuscuta australis TaxID=267555 RepID=A0A328D8B1_9ASTE|nr:hypothetical protein DM860_006599 [Cuscuta australis]
MPVLKIFTKRCVMFSFIEHKMQVQKRIEAHRYLIAKCIALVIFINLQGIPASFAAVDQSLFFFILFTLWVKKDRDGFRLPAIRAHLLTRGWREANIVRGINLEALIRQTKFFFLDTSFVQNIFFVKLICNNGRCRAKGNRSLKNWSPPSQGNRSSLSRGIDSHRGTPSSRREAVPSLPFA